MAKRKSVNKRLSRYSKYSTGSGILDPDSNIYGDERPYWWKNLENNSVARASTGFDILNETSPHLNATSQIETSVAEDGWWKALETLDSTFSTIIVADDTKKGTTNNAESTLESEEEPRVVKRKLPMRLQGRNSQGNAFLNALNDSDTSDSFQPLHKTTKKDSTDNSASSNRIASHSKQHNQTSGSSLNQSKTADDILKSKPKIFQRRRMDKDKHVFEDVLQESKIESPSKRKFSRLSSIRSLKSSTENETPATNDTSVIDKAETNRFAWSFEAFSPIPKAHSTVVGSSMLVEQNRNTDSSPSMLVEQNRNTSSSRSMLVEKNRNTDSSSNMLVKKDGNTSGSPSMLVEQDRNTSSSRSMLVEKNRNISGSRRMLVDKNKNTDSSRSDTETEIIKPKPKLLRRHNRSIAENLFKHALDFDRTDNRKEADTLGNDTVATNASPMKSSIPSTEELFKIPQVVSTNILGEMKSGVAKRNRTSRSAEKNISNAAFARHVKESAENKSASDNASSDNSEIFRNVRKVKSKFLRKPRRSLMKNIFLDLLEEDQNVNALETYKTVYCVNRSSNSSLILSEFSDEDDVQSKGNASKSVPKDNDHNVQRSEIDSEENRKSTQRTVVRLSMEHSRTRSRETASSSENVDEKSWNKESRISNLPHDKSANIDASRSLVRVLESKKNRASDAEIGNETSHLHFRTHSDDEREEIVEEGKRSSRKLYANESTRTLDHSDNKRKNIFKTSNNSLNKSRKKFILRVTSESDTDEDRNTPKEQAGSSGSFKQSTLSAVVESQPDNVQHTPRKQSGNLSRSGIESNMPVASEPESPEVQSTPKRPGGIISSLPKQSTAINASESNIEGQSPSKGRSERVSIAQKLRVLHTTSESEQDDVEDTVVNRKTSNSKTSQKQLNSSSIDKMGPEKDQITPKRQSKSVSRSQKLRVVHSTSESGQDDVEDIVANGNSERSQKQSISSSKIKIGPEKDQITPQKQSKNLSRSQMVKVLHTTSESDQDGVEDTMTNRNSKTSQKQLNSSSIDKMGPEKDQITPQKQSKNLSRSQMVKVLHTTSESDQDDVEDTMTNRNSERSQKQSISSSIDKMRPEKDQITPKRLSKSLSRSQKSMVLHVTSESELDGVQDTTANRQTSNLKRSQKQSILSSMNKMGPEELESISERQSENSSGSLKLRVVPTSSESEQVDVEGTVVNRNSERSQKQLNSSRMKEMGPQEVESTSERQSESLSRSQKSTVLQTTRESEKADVEDTMANRQTSNSKRSQKESISSSITNMGAEKVESTSKGQSESSSGSLKLRMVHTSNESEQDDVEDTTANRQTSNSKRSQNQSILSSKNKVEPGNDESTSKRQSKSSSGAQMFRVVHTSSESEQDRVKGTVARRKSERLQKQLNSSGKNNMGPEKDESTSKGQSESLSRSQMFSVLHTASESEQDDVEGTMGKRNSKTSQKQSISSSKKKIEPEKEESTSKRQSKSSSRSQKFRVVDTSRESEQNDVVGTMGNRNSKTSQKQLNSSSMKKMGPQEVESISERQSKSLSRSQMSRVLQTSSESEQDGVQDTTANRQTSNSKRSQNQSVLSSKNKVEPGNDESTSKRQSKSSSGAQMFRVVDTSSESEQDDVVGTMGNRNSKTSQKQSISSSKKKIEPEKEESTSKGPSESLSRSQMFSVLHTASESEQDDVVGTMGKRNSKTSQKQSISSIKKKIEPEKEEGTSKRQSKSSSGSHKFRVVDTSSESEQDDVVGTMGNRNSKRSQSQSISSSKKKIEPEKHKSTSQRQSKSSSGSQNFRVVDTSSESEQDDVIGTMGNRNSKTSQKQSISSSKKKIEPEKEESTSKGQSKNSSGSHKFRVADTSSELEQNDVKGTMGNKNSKRWQKQLNSSSMKKMGPQEVESISERQSKSLSRSQMSRVLQTSSESEQDGVQDTTANRQTSNSKRSQNQSILSSKNKVEPGNDESTSKRQSKSSSGAQMFRVVDTSSESEQDDVAGTMGNRNSKTSQKQSISSSKKKIEPEKEESTSKGPSESLSRSQMFSVLHTASESEQDDVVGTMGNRNSKTSQKQSTSSSKKKIEPEKDENTSKRQSKSSSGSQMSRVLQTSSESEQDDVEDTMANRQTSNSKRSQRQLNSSSKKKIEPEEDESTPKRQRKSSSGSQKFRVVDTSSESEQDDVEGTVVNRNSKTSQRQLNSSSKKKIEPEKDQSTPKRQSKSTNRSEKLTVLHTTSKSEFYDVESNELERLVEKRSKNLSRSRLSYSPVMDVADPDEDQQVSKSRSRDSSRTQKPSRLLVGNDSESHAFGEKITQSPISHRSRQPQSLPVVPSTGADDLEESGKSQSKKLSISSKRLFSPIVDKVEAKKDEDTTEIPNTGLSKWAKKWDVGIESGSENGREMSRRGKRSRNARKKHSDLSVPAESSSDESGSVAWESFKKSVASAIYEPNSESSPSTSKRSAAKLQKRGPSVPDVIDRLKDRNVLRSRNDISREPEQVADSRDREILKEPQPVDKESKAAPTVKISGKHGSEKENFTERGGTVSKDSRIAASPGIKANVPNNQTNIRDFFKVGKLAPISQVFSDKEKVEKIKKKLEVLKKRELDTLVGKKRSTERKKLSPPAKKARGMGKSRKSTQDQRPAKHVDKAFLVNGVAYKVPRLPRPKPWITNRFYSYLWKVMEPKYKLNTRVVSEKFVRQLSEVTTLILKQKSYDKYKAELYALMKEMARLGIIRTRHDFYNFCYDFFPYDIRIKTLPMWQPGNKTNIPYDPEKLDKPLLNTRLCSSNNDRS